MRYAILISAIILFFCSCLNDSGSNLEVFRTSDAGFKMSTETITSSNMQIYYALESRLHDPQYRRAEIWQPIAMQIHLISDSIAQYVNELKIELKKEAGSYTKNGIELYHEENIKAVNLLFKKKGKELFDKLIRYRGGVLLVDSLLTNEFKHRMALFSNDFDYPKRNEQEFIKNFFNDIPSIAAMALLSKFENDIKINENRFITFCFNQTYHGFCGYNRYVPLFVQSSNYLKVGDDLEIIAGIGSFSVESLPEVTIDGKIIPANVDGFSVYKFKTSNAGKYVKPVKIQYTKPDGTKGVMTKNIEYTVIASNQNPK